jgi:hypothetical protein
MRRPYLRAQDVGAGREIPELDAVEPLIGGAGQHQLAGAIHLVAVRFNQQRAVLGIRLDGHEDANGRGLDEVSAVQADLDDVARIAAGGPPNCEKGG